MTDTKQYGKLLVEQTAEESVAARNVVTEILNFGVSQQQILRIAYLLALELEDRNAMVEISNCIKQFLTSISDEAEDEEKYNNARSKSGIITT
jgi:hypothetical protein